MTATRKIYSNQVNYLFEPLPNCLVSNTSGIFEVSNVFAYISKCLTFQPNAPISIKSISTYCNDLDRRVVIKSIAFLCLTNVIIIDSVTRYGLYMRLNYEFIELKSDKTFDVASRNQGSFSRDNNKKLKIYLNALCDIGLGDIVARKDHHIEQYMSLKLKGKVVDLNKHKKANCDRTERKTHDRIESSPNLGFRAKTDRTERSPSIAQSDYLSIAQSDHKTPFSIAQSDHIRDLFDTKKDTEEETNQNAAAAVDCQTSLGSDSLSLRQIQIQAVEGECVLAHSEVPSDTGTAIRSEVVLVDRDDIGNSSVIDRATHNRKDKEVVKPQPEAKEQKKNLPEVINQVAELCSAELLDPDREENAKIASIASCFITEYTKHHPAGKNLTKGLLNRLETYSPFIVTKLYEKGADQEQVELFVEAIYTIEGFGNSFLTKKIVRDDLVELCKTYNGRSVFDDVYEIMLKCSKVSKSFFDQSVFLDSDFGDIEF